MAATKAAVWKYTLNAAKKHALVQGQVISAANLVQDEFFQLFLNALGLERPDEFGAQIRFHSHALAIWHVVQSDSSQRDMAIAAISTVPTNLRIESVLPRARWAKNQANKLGEYRNLLAHSPIMFTGQMRRGKVEMIPLFAAQGMRPQHRDRLKLIQGMGFWKTLRNDLFALSAYVRALNVQIQRIAVEARGAHLVGAPVSWPHKPRLRSLPRLQAIDRALRQAIQTSKHHSRRQSSLA